MSDRRYDNPDWQLGMTLPSRKETHGKKKKSKKGIPQPELPAVEEEQKQDVPEADVSTQEPVHSFSPDPSPEVEAEAEEPLDRFPAVPVPDGEPVPVKTVTKLKPWQALPDDDDLEEESHPEPTPAPQEEAVAAAAAELALGQAETAAAIAVPAPDFTDTVSDDERDLLLNGEEDDDSILNPWQKALLFVAVPLVLLIALAWGKLAYVHKVPDLVRHNTTVYEQGQAYLVLKPWWFGPPIFELDHYIDPTYPDDFDHLRIKMGDYSGIVEEPYVLWTFQQDLLQ